MQELLVSAKRSRSRSAGDRADLIEQILDQLDPLIVRQRRAVAQQGCLRAMSSTQLHVLFLLVTDGPQPMTHLADQLGVSLPNVTGIVDRMVEHGYVERSRDDDDRRLVIVCASQAGREAVEEIDLVRRRSLSGVLEQLTPEQLQRTLSTFCELRSAIEAADEAH